MPSPDRAEDEAGYRGLLAALPQGAAAEVDAAMGQPHRHYHARWHLGRMWRLHARHQARDWSQDLGWAIAYHDIVYDPRNAPRRNEFESAACFLRAAHEAGLGLEASSRIAGWILASADHLGAGAFLSPIRDPAGAWFLDLDLEPLASEDFVANSALIRSEYGHVPEDDFRRGRSEFLAGILQSPAIFRTEEAVSLGWETAARRNIAEQLGKTG